MVSQATARAMTALLGLVLLLSAGCGGGTTGPSTSLPASLTIGIVDSLSGPSAPSCGPEVNGMKLAVKEAQDQKYLGNTTINTSIVDDKSTPEAALSGYKDLQSSGVVAFLGPCLSGNAVVTSQQVDRDKLPEIINIVSAKEVVAHKFAFRGGLPQTEFVANTVKVVAGRGIKSVAVVHATDNPDLVAIWTAWSAQISKSGLRLTGDFPTQFAVKDLSAEIAKIRDQNPDAIGLDIQGQNNIAAARQIRAAGLKQPIFGQVAMDFSFYYGDPAADGSIFATSFDPSINDKAIQSFAAQYKSQFNADATYSSAAGYDGVWRLLRALKDAQSTDPSAIRTALEKQKSFDGPEGHIVYTNSGHDITGNGFVLITQGGVRTVQQIPK
jgi:branched-chain amino acid transport system substrate-binding protein